MIFLFLSISIYQLPEVTVIGERYGDLPFMVRIISSDELKNFSSIGDVLKSIPGINVMDYGTHGSMSSVQSMGARSNHTQIMIDGVPVNDPKTGMFDLSLIPINSVKKIEVIEGAGTVFKGRNSISSAINIITGNRELSISGGSYGLLSLNFGRDIKKKSFNAYVERFDGFRENSYGYLFNSNLQFKNNRLFLTLKEIGVPGPVPNSYIPAFGDSNVSSKFNSEKDLYILYSLPISIKDINFQPFLSYSLMLPYTKYRDFSTYKQVDENDFYSTYSLGINLSYFINDFEIRLDARVDSIEMIQKKHIESESLLTISWGRMDWSSNISLIYTKNISNLSIFTSGRYDYNREFKGVPDFTIGIRYKGKFSPYLSVGSGYRRPSLNELYWPNWSNPELRPEKAISFNTGLSSRYLSINGFYRSVKDKIGPDENWIPQNINNADIYGFNFSLNYSSPLVSIDGGFDYTKGVERLYALSFYDSSFTPHYSFFNRDLCYTPDKKLRLLFTFNIKPSIGVEFVHIGKMVKSYRSTDFSVFPPEVKDTTESLSSYSIVNVNMFYEIGPLLLNFKLNNLFNLKYTTFFGYPGDNGYPGSPRSFRIYLIYNKL